MSIVFCLLMVFLTSYEYEYSDKESGKYIMMAVGLTVGLINYYSPILEEPVLWLAPIFLLIILGSFVYFLIWWDRRGKGLGSLLPILAVMMLLFIAARNATAATTRYWNNALWQSLMWAPTFFVGGSCTVISLAFWLRKKLLKEGGMKNE